MSKPCTWCEREDQETCPDCNGTGFVDDDDAPKDTPSPDPVYRIFNAIRKEALGYFDAEGMTYKISAESLVLIEDEAKADLEAWGKRQRLEEVRQLYFDISNHRGHYVKTEALRLLNERETELKTTLQSEMEKTG